MVSSLSLVVGLYSFADLAGYTIGDYDSNIVLTTGGELQISEQIQVNFSEPRHGIYRKIPYRYDGSQGSTITTSIYDITVPLHEYSFLKTKRNYEIKKFSFFMQLCR